MIYQFKITLKGIKPPIWRRFQVESNIKFAKLHDVIQVIMGWTHSHLYEFNFGYTSILMPHDGEKYNQELDSSKIAISKYFSQEKQKVEYTYDFGDNWEHQLVLEKIIQKQATGKVHPVCLDGKRNCPPEDCGGVYGYYELQEVLQDPTHSEYEDMIEWIGEDHDFEGFDLEEINRRLRPKRSSTRGVWALKE